MRMQLVPSVGSAGFLDLPWAVPLEEWPEEILVHAARGIGRHVVRFVDCGGTLYALKELPPPLAEREYRRLREMATEGVPAVDAVGVVRDRASARANAGAELQDVIITRYLEFALPLRLVIARRPLPDLLDRLLDAFVELLVRLHLAGFFWGDCSLSNTLFRRDAGALAAFLVDAETCERHAQLSTGQRLYDLDIAMHNVYGELLDVEAELGDDGNRDPDAVVAAIRERYDGLWDELTAEETFAPGERHRLEERLRRLNELGFDVEEIELVASEEGYRLRLEPSVVEPGHHRRRLLRLTGLVAQENQARRLLNDIASYRVALEQQGNRFASEAAAAGRWLAEIFEPAVAAVPVEFRGKRAAAELFHELLDHRWRLSEGTGRDVGLEEAIASYVDTVLREATDEKTTVSELRPRV